MFNLLTSRGGHLINPKLNFLRRPFEITNRANCKLARSFNQLHSSSLFKIQLYATAEEKQWRQLTNCYLLLKYCSKVYNICCHCIIIIDKMSKTTLNFYFWCNLQSRQRLLIFSIMHIIDLQ